jgi:hypothetical protein
MADWVKAKGQGFEPVQFSSVEARLAQRTLGLSRLRYAIDSPPRTHCCACARAHARLRSLTVGRRARWPLGRSIRRACIVCTSPHAFPRFSVSVGCAECSLPSEYSSTLGTPQQCLAAVSCAQHTWLGLAYRTAQRQPPEPIYDGVGLCIARCIAGLC